MTRGAWTRGLAVLLLAPRLRAQPSIWERVRRPEAAAEHRALVAAERLWFSAGSEKLRPLERHERLLRALGTLEAAGAPAHRDPRLRLLYGELLVDVDVGRDAEAAELLDRTLAEASGSALAARAWFDLAVASARSGRPERERDAYTRVLELATDRDFRATCHMNRGESNMVLGRLDEAVRDYRAAVKLSSSSPVTVGLARWGLGVALERNGDLPSALGEIEQAMAVLTPGGLRHHWPLEMLPGVFFVPSFDVHYYEGLGALVRLRRAPPEEIEDAARACTGHFARYLAGAEAARHAWVDAARRHLSACERRLDALEAKPQARRRTK